METFSKKLIAPCGMNCALCGSYLSYRNNLKSRGIQKTYCRGCREENKNCTLLKRKCYLLSGNKIQYCFQCDIFPCKSLMQLDKRYRNFYRMSEIDNLIFIKENGEYKFLKKQMKEWKCENCGELICCHNGICFNCGIDKLKIKKRRYRWDD